ncbi:MAG TPA: protein kinase, partial [Pyrinomonadaceae bacterium]|nr:protein kinase [Pyrinomonadaceae bacterium]
MKTDDWQKIKEVFNATLDLPENERAAFLEKQAASLRQEVQKLINAHEEANNFIVESALVDVGLIDKDETDFYVGKQIDDYKILKEIGHGGMGTVYLAVKADESFDKKFAIKLIKRGMDTNAVLKRFVMERKILAQLENPNIASLIDGGSTIDGLPYLVMEYIEGETITKFCDLHQFSIEERLELFRKVCAAVSYAHQNLVVHRDIKPSNILVTADGTPKLLDFGIAKLLHPDWSLENDEATATMFRLMTPEYASPEQIRGLPITTASDVYSLGVVLYELLSGKRPYQIESRLPQDIANVILTEDPVRPSAVTKKGGETGRQGDRETKSNNPPTPSLPFSLSQLRGDLDNIILKALRKEPERRYQTVQEFSEDIRRHLVGLPVTATADTTFYRVGKFVKRHRIGVLVSVLFALTLVSATAITTWQAIVAKRERARAEQHFNQVRKLANTVLFDYHDDVAKLAGSTPLREKMVKDALEYLDNLSAGNIADKDLQLELAAAYQKIGDVQGNPYFANLGNEDGAFDSYKKALIIRQTLFSANPTDDNIKYELGNSFNNVGDILWAKGENEDALLTYRQGLQLFEELSKNDSQNPKYFSGLNYSLNGIAHVQTQLGDSKGALETYRRNLT